VKERPAPYVQRERAAERQTATTHSKAHGRQEQRTLTSTTALNFYLQRTLGWSGVRQVFRVTRDCAWTDRVTGERRTSRETVYGITSLSRDRADAARLLELNRQHWTIENGVFYVRDETFGEDRIRIRTQSGPQVMAVLRNAALRLLRLSGSTNISANLRSCSWITHRTRNLLSIV
jgi:predicted transposase YbfD/YdcC